MQEASPQQILAAVPEEYLLGNQAMYLFAYNNVKGRRTRRTDTSATRGAKTTLKALCLVQSEHQARSDQPWPRRTPTSS
jgi:hypothetical protein